MAVEYLSLSLAQAALLYTDYILYLFLHRNKNTSQERNFVWWIEDLHNVTCGPFSFLSTQIYQTSVKKH
jgi:hypothetical protein